MSDVFEDVPEFEDDEAAKRFYAEQGARLAFSALHAGLASPTIVSADYGNALRVTSDNSTHPYTLNINGTEYGVGRKARKAIAEALDLTSIDWGAEHAMPVEFKWPRFEDGAKVRPGDLICFVGEVDKVREIHLAADCLHLHCEAANYQYAYGERVQRPGIVTHDCVQVQRGDYVWDMDTGERFTVAEPTFDIDGRILVKVQCNQRTVADYLPGRPIHPVITMVPDRLLSYDPDEDNWERIRKDAERLGETGKVDPDDIMALVNRAKALMEDSDE